MGRGRNSYLLEDRMHGFGRQQQLVGARDDGRPERERRRLYRVLPQMGDDLLGDGWATRCAPISAPISARRGSSSPFGDWG